MSPRRPRVKAPRLDTSTPGDHAFDRSRSTTILTLAYAAFSLLGCLYIVYSAFSGHGIGGGQDGAAAHSVHGPDTHYGVEGHGHGSASAGNAAPGAFHFPFFSPLALATLFAAVGAYGLIALHGLGAGEGLSLAIAVPAAVATAYGVTYVGFRLMSSSRGSSEIRLAQLAGALAEVITPIPPNGVGEVAALVDGQRFACAAREEQGHEVARGARVKVKEMVGTTLVVVKES